MYVKSKTHATTTKKTRSEFIPAVLVVTEPALTPVPATLCNFSTFIK